MKWTKKRPTKSKPYWYRDVEEDSDRTPCVVELERQDGVLGLADGFFFTPAKELSGEWSDGPIPEPED